MFLYLLTVNLDQVGAADPGPATPPIPALAGYDFQAETAMRWKLPGRLREISGLAMTPDQRLLAHNDEKGTIYEIDYQTGSVTKAFELAQLYFFSVEDDFEGIAVADDWLYLVTSAGWIYQFREGDDGQTVAFDTYDTGIGRECEIEGLAYEPQSRSLLLACKNAHRPDQQGLLTIFRWSIDAKQRVDGGHLSIPVTAFIQHTNKDTFQPSGIELNPGSGSYFIVAARQHAIAEVTPDGRVLAVVEFAAKRHRQIEGVTVTGDGTLILADEGEKKRARLTLYPVGGN